MDLRSSRFLLQGLLGGASVAFGLWSGASPLAAADGRLRGHVPAPLPWLQPIRRLEATNLLQLAIGLPLRQRSTLTHLLDQLYDPVSPCFRRFLTSEQFTQQFGPSDEDYQAVTAYMVSHGLRVRATHPNRVLLDVEGSVLAIESAFEIHLGVYAHPTEPRTFFAPDTEPQLDQAIPVLHISGLDNYVLPRAAGLRMRPPRLAGDPTPATGSGPSGNYGGKDFRNAYVPGVTLTGTGQSVGLFELCGYYPQDIALYEQEFGLPNVPLVNVLLDGVADITENASSTNGMEAPVDIEMTISMAPGLAQVMLYFGYNPDSILNRMATDNLARQLSASWIFSGDSTTSQIYKQMAAQGQSYFTASGDSDAYTGPLPGLLDVPYITVVGGTTLNTRLSGSWVAETTWNWGGGVGSSGGISTQYPIPVWQQGINMTANLGSTSMRNIPDVAMVADNVWARWKNGDVRSVGGTSISSPLWAGFTALVNQQAAINGQPSLGFANPALYAIGKGTGYGAAFHDIRTGNNTSSTSKDRFTAVAGYDLCTGWGSPTGSNLIAALVALTDPLYVTPPQASPPSPHLAYPLALPI